MNLKTSRQFLEAIINQLSSDLKQAMQEIESLKLGKHISPKQYATVEDNNAELAWQNECLEIKVEELNNEIKELEEWVVTLEVELTEARQELKDVMVPPDWA